MAKALMGHLGQDPRAASEVARLRTRVRELEAELESLRDERTLGGTTPLLGESADTDVIDLARATPVLA